MTEFEALKRKNDNEPVRFLIVDDSVFARKSLAKMVESFGGQVVGEAGDGCTAIAEYARTKPDMILMDITMPQMEGIEAVEHIVREHPEARVIMVSSVGYQGQYSRRSSEGRSPLSCKSRLRPTTLYEIVRYVLNDEAVASSAGVGGEISR